MPLTRRQFLASSAVAALPLAATSSARPRAEAKVLVLVAGAPSHGPGDHEFNAGVKLLAKCLKGVPELTVRTVLSGYPKDESVFEGASGILCYADGGAGHPFAAEGRFAKLEKLVEAGCGFLCAHYGVEVLKDKGGTEMKRLIGGYYENGYSVNPMWTPEFLPLPSHPITNGVKPFQARDEWYFNMRFRADMQGVTPILSAKPSDAVRNGPYVYPKGPYPHIQEAKGREEHVMWCVADPGRGRGAGFTGGHFHKNWADDNFRKVVLNALLWICQVDVPPGGVESTLGEGDLTAGLDPKPRR